MDRQAIYNKVRAHLLSMEAPAGKWDGGSFRCAYLDENGRQCAMGPFIPEGHPGLYYGGDISGLLDNYNELEGVFGVNTNPEDTYGDDYDEDVEFLTELQQVHDQVRSADDPDTPGGHWGPGGLNDEGRNALDLVAEMYGLTIEGG